MTNEENAIANTETDAIANDSEVIDTPEVETAPAAEAKPDAPKDRRSVIADALKDYKPDATTAEAAPEEKPATELKPGQEIDSLTGRVLEPIKAPASMSADLREEWAKIPRRTQQYWVDREKHISTVLTQTADARKFYDEFKDVSAPYEQLFKKSNITATAHAKELFDLSYRLNTGTPQQKAQVIATLMNHFQPDPATLQAIFSGQPVNVPPMQAPQRQMTQEEYEAQVLAKYHERTAAEQAQPIIDAFASDPQNEFYDDVKEMMGNIIQNNIVSGSDVNELLRNAYNLAVSQHPGVQGALRMRGATAGAANAPAGGLNAPTAAAQPQGKPVPSVKPSLGAGNRSASTQRFSSRRAAAQAALEQSGFKFD